MITAINAIPGLQAMDNDLLPLTIGATDVDLQLVMADMRGRGWILVGAATPPLINVPLDPAADDRIVNTFLVELTEATAKARAASGRAAGSGELNY